MIASNGRISSSIPVLVTLIAVWVLLIIPFKIIGYGFLPDDDALRHSAKAVTDRDWREILIIRDSIKNIDHPGWAFILKSIHKIAGWDAHSLVLFSVISLSILFLLLPLFFLRYPESWLCSCTIVAIISATFINRLFRGRPYIFAMAILIVWCYIWPKLNDKKSVFKTSLLFVLLAAVFTWIYYQWYLLALPLLALICARQWRAAGTMAVCLVAGVLIGTSCSGHTISFVIQPVKDIISYFFDGRADMNYMLANETKSSFINVSLLVFIILALVWRSLRNEWDRKIIDNPVFILGIGSLILGCAVKRFYLDWGVPALMVWFSQEFESYFKKVLPLFSWHRIILVVILSGTLYLTVTSDVDSRWSSYAPKDHLSANNPDQSAWLPEPGGIIYSDDYSVFYQTFFNNPNADWRYMLGCEPAIMPQEDLATFRDIQRNANTYKAFEPWVRKMKLSDRLVIRGGEDNRPKIPELEWNYAALNTWIGRLPRKK